MTTTTLRASVLVLCVTGCATSSSPPVVYSASPRGNVARAGNIPIRGRAPRGRTIDHVVAVQVDHRTGKRVRIRVPAGADGSYQLELPRGHHYEVAYESGGALVGRVEFPRASGAPSATINLSNNVIITQQFVDLGEPVFHDGVFVAAQDPEEVLDSDGDGVADAADPDPGLDDATEDLTADAAFEGDFEEADEPGEVSNREND